MMYRLAGVVVRGKQLGRTLGYPTANILPQTPCTDGVYYGQTLLRGSVFHSAVSVGKSPTVAGKAFCVEVHLFGWHGEEFYGEEITVLLVRFLRGMRKVAGVDDLREMIQGDARQIEQEILPSTPLFTPSEFN